MKKNISKFILCLGVLSTIGCFSAYSKELKTTEVIIHNTKNSMDEIKTITLEKRDLAVAKAKAVMTYLDSRIEDLEESISDKTNSMSDSMREAKAKTLAKLKEERKEVNAWFIKLENSSKDAWEEIKHGFIKSYDAFQNTYHNS